MTVAGEQGQDGLIPTTDRFGTALSDIVGCTRCGHMQLEEFPAEAELEHAYEDAESYDYVAEEAGQRETARVVLERIERQVPTGRLLDLGCWVGFLLSEAEKRGWDSMGVEPSAFASAFANERFGLDVRKGNLLDVDLPERAFDAVFLGDVIEHMIDPGLTLRRVRDLLAPGGVVAMTLPDSGSRLARAMGPKWWSVIPTHVQYFTRGSMRVLLEREGFEVRALYTSPKAFTVSYYLDRIAGYSEPLSAALVTGAERMGVADRLWAPDFRDRMLVVARPGG